MLGKYVKKVIYLDRTYETTDYALPLFLLVVHTPAGYVAVGEFIIQLKTAEHNEEALNIFNKWCPAFNSKYWIIQQHFITILQLSVTSIVGNPGTVVQPKEEQH